MEHLFPSAHRILSKIEHFLREQPTANIMKMSERTRDWVDSYDLGYKANKTGIHSQTEL